MRFCNFPGQILCKENMNTVSKVGAWVLVFCSIWGVTYSLMEVKMKWSGTMKKLNPVISFLIAVLACVALYMLSSGQ